MSRLEKGSRFKNLPPKILKANEDGNTKVIGLEDQVFLQDYLNGSFKQETTFAFNDSAVIDINTLLTVSLPTGIPVSNSILLTNQELTSSFNVVSNIVSANLQQWQKTNKNLISSSFVSFRDHCLLEADAVANQTKDVFFTTGSSVSDFGEGFSEPLWSKEKFEIDITPTIDCCFGIQNYNSTSNNYMMAYWNKDEKKYEGIGSGKEFAEYNVTDVVTMNKFLSEKACSFGTSMDNSGVNTGFVSASYLIGNPISNFGFPSSDKYEATGSQLINLTDYIKKPFLLEKVVLYFSGSLNLHNTSNTIACMTTFFVMNQRGAQINKISYPVQYSSGSTLLDSETINETNITTTRDLITWLQISAKDSSVYPDYTSGLQREYNYTPINFSAPLKKQFDEQLVVSGNCKSAFAYQQGQNSIINVTTTGGLKTSEYVESLSFSGRNMIGDNGRSFVNPWTDPKILGYATFPSFWGGGSYNSLVNKEYKKNNPYILMPGDQLIFGWQLPYKGSPFNENVGGIPTYDKAGPALTASMNGTHKVVFYGSYLDGKGF
jgi:hypothetical protein